MTDRLDKFFNECECLLAMVEPYGSVSAQDFGRLLTVAKQFREINMGSMEKTIRIPRLKTQAEIKESFD